MKTDTRDYILVKGASEHNLKNVDIDIPKRKFVVFTGLSGSGKSSLAFDTIYAEGQRRYVESLSTYARQFLGKIKKPHVEYIKGLVPSIAIEQKVQTANVRSTVGTMTEIYDYLKILYARLGKTYSPVSGQEVVKQQVGDVVNDVLTFDTGLRCQVLAPIDLTTKDDEERKQRLRFLADKGFVRIMVDGKVQTIQDLVEKETTSQDKYSLVIDRLKTADSKSFIDRLADSVQQAFEQGDNYCDIQIFHPDGEEEIRRYSHRFEADGMTFIEPNTHFFSFNNAYGYCPTCEGYGKTLGIEEDLVVPNRGLSLYDGAVLCWRGKKSRRWVDNIVETSEESNFPIHSPYYELTDEQKHQLWHGCKHFKGIYAFFDHLATDIHKIQNRVMIARFRGRTHCRECDGARLRKETSYVKFHGKDLMSLVKMPVKEVKVWVDQLVLTPQEEVVGKRIFFEVQHRISSLIDLGLGYLSLNRSANTLSGGETQRINLTTCVGSSLVGSAYVLDEPSIGLHPRDTDNLISVLQRLRDNGNTVLVVEHDEDIIRKADYIVDMGPRAGTQGGHIMLQGAMKDISTSEALTYQYICGERIVPWRHAEYTPSKSVTIKGARLHNLKNVSATIPLEALTVVTGVSGSGKSSLIQGILYPAILKHLGEAKNSPGDSDGIEGDLDHITYVDFISQGAIGKSSRSNPITYIKAYDDIRTLFATQPTAKAMKLQARHFSFNMDGGRCPNCEGEGVVHVSMQFMSDIDIPCEVCAGKRFKEDILNVRFGEKNIHEVLEMTVDEAIDFFEKNKRKVIAEKLRCLQEVGLGYVKLSQPSAHLSGGEAQRVKLAYYLSKRGSLTRPAMFIFDEPTTGLHFYDVDILLRAFYALIAQGHTIVVVEHHLDVIKCADHIIDLGPSSGDQGGSLVFEGSPMQMIKAKNSKSETARYLREKYDREKEHMSSN